jgi:hypothetical protein
LKGLEMQKHINRIDTVLDIMHYMDAPILQNKFETFYNDDIDSLVLLAKDQDSVMLLHMYAFCEDTPAPAEIQTVFDMPQSRVVFLSGSKLEEFADSRVEFLLMLRSFRV